jgi:hypothetical protein
LEIRWLPRISELQQDWQQHCEYNSSLLPAGGSTLAKNETVISLDVVESDQVEENVPASSILGRVGTCISAADDKEPSDAVVLPIQCRVYDLWQLAAYHPVVPLCVPPPPPRGRKTKETTYEASIHVELARFLQRSCYYSQCLPRYPGLRGHPTYKSLLVKFRAGASDLRVAPQSLWRDQDASNGPDSSGQIVFYESIKLSPPWECYVNPLCRLDISFGAFQWTVQVGDFVTVRAKESGEGRLNFPFTVPWRTAQVLTIYKKKESASLDDDGQQPQIGDQQSTALYSLELRFFRVESDSNGCEWLYESGEITSSCTTMDLLAPLVLGTDVAGSKSMVVDAKGLLDRTEVVVQRHPYLPAVSFLYGGAMNQQQSSASQRALDDLKQIVRRGIDMATHYTTQQQRDHFWTLYETRHDEHVKKQEQSITAGSFMKDYFENVSPDKAAFDQEEEEDNDKDHPMVSDRHSTVSGESRIQAAYDPIHIDKASQRAFYDKIQIQPEYSDMNIWNADSNRYSSNTDRVAWDVKLGDIVVVNYENQYKSSGPAYFEPNTVDDKIMKKETGKNFPFYPSWGGTFRIRSRPMLA